VGLPLAVEFAKQYPMVGFDINCPDIRNTKIIDIYNELKEYGVNPYVFDPVVLAEDVITEYGIKLTDIQHICSKKYDMIIHCVQHQEFQKEKFLNLVKNAESVVFDVKGSFPSHLVDFKL